MSRAPAVLLIFSLYEAQNDVAPRGIEHKVVTLAAHGGYSVQLGHRAHRRPASGSSCCSRSGSAADYPRDRLTAFFRTEVQLTVAFAMRAGRIAFIRRVQDMLLKRLIGNGLRAMLTANAYRRLRKEGLLDVLGRRPADAIPPDYVDLDHLYHLVRRLQPKTILEFGSGYSTSVLAMALLRNSAEGHGGRLYSCDSSAEWAEATRSALTPDLRRFCEIRHTPIEYSVYGSTRVVRHTNIPDLSEGIDLLYLDGPPLTDACRVSIDPVDLQDRFNPGMVLVVDGRRENVKFLRKLFVDPPQAPFMRFKPNRLVGQPIFVHQG